MSANWRRLSDKQKARGINESRIQRLPKRPRVLRILGNLGVFIERVFVRHARGSGLSARPWRPRQPQAGPVPPTASPTASAPGPLAPSRAVPAHRSASAPRLRSRSAARRALTTPRRAAATRTLAPCTVPCRRSPPGPPAPSRAAPARRTAALRARRRKRDWWRGRRILKRVTAASQANPILRLMMRGDGWWGRLRARARPSRRSRWPVS